jgi:hypothetical protein
LEVTVRKTSGLHNDLLLRIPREELASVRLHIANRGGFLEEKGLLRGPEDQDKVERSRVAALKRPIEDHLQSLGLLEDGIPNRRVVAVGCRNLGNNRGFHAWQRDESPRAFVIQGDSLPSQVLPLLACDRDGTLVLRHLRVTSETLRTADGADCSDEFEWCAFANCVLRDGHLIPMEEMADRFYDIAHLIGISREAEGGRESWAKLFEGFSLRSREEIVGVLRECALPRNRFLHNAIGLSKDVIVILQREGTPEEIGAWLRDAGATDGFILDNGGSVFCWAWWVNQTGGYLFQAPDFRPPSSAILAFVLYGPARTALPPGSVSPTVV